MQQFRVDKSIVGKGILIVAVPLLVQLIFFGGQFALILQSESIQKE